MNEVSCAAAVSDSKEIWSLVFFVLYLLDTSLILRLSTLCDRSVLSVLKGVLSVGFTAQHVCMMSYTLSGQWRGLSNVL